MWSCIIIIIGIIAMPSSWSYDQKLTKALVDIVGDIKFTNDIEKDNEKKMRIVAPSSLRRRCHKSLACEYHQPMVEIENAIYMNGVLYLNKPDKQVMAYISLSIYLSLFLNLSLHLD
jgi:hypothetical protein